MARGSGAKEEREGIIQCESEGKGLALVCKTSVVL